MILKFGFPFNKRHADLLAADLDHDTLIQYLDRFMLSGLASIVTSADSDKLNAALRVRKICST